MVGLLSIIPIGVHLISQAGGISMMNTSPPVPAGIGGWVKDIDSLYVPDGTPVYAKNLATDEIAYRSTQNGYYAIPISARTGDNVRVTAYMGTDKAEKIITVDLGKSTQWCNLTFGVDKGVVLNLWLFIIPIGLVSGGLTVDYVGKKEKYK